MALTAGALVAVGGAAVGSSLNIGAPAASHFDVHVSRHPPSHVNNYGGEPVLPRSSSSAQAPGIAALRFVRDLQRWGENRLRAIPAEDATTRVVRILTHRGRLAARVASRVATSVRMAPGRLGEYVATSVVGNFLISRRGRDWRVVSLPGD